MAVSLKYYYGTADITIFTDEVQFRLFNVRFNDYYDIHNESSQFVKELIEDSVKLVKEQAREIEELKEQLAELSDE